jgi:hypothetical protein
MRRFALFTLFSLAAQASFAGGLSVGDSNATSDLRPIHISCFRGPWHGVIWDRPQGTFVEDLVTYGYDHANADALATMICRDERLIGRPELMKEALLREMRKTPPTK